jgi:glycosyltransferase involved in cell wall biosynthesis
MNVAMDERRFCIYIPCHNGARFLARTVGRIPWAQLPAGPEYSVLFVDNASRDNTREEIEKLRDGLNKADAILHPVNRGYGGSVKSAFDYCLRKGIGQIAVLHADGQYAPEELPKLIGDFRSNAASALHFGSRLRGAPLKGGMPLYKWAANHVLTRLQNAVLGLRLSEYHSGYRLYRMSLVDKIPWRKASDGFVFDNEIIFLLRQHGLAITESPISTFYGEEKSYVPKLGTPLAILRNMLMYVLASNGLRKYPLYSP